MAKVYGKALMLWNFLEDIRTKISSFMYSVLTYCMQDTVAGQDVIRSDNSRDFPVLFKRLKERFQINSEIAKEKLVSEFFNQAEYTCDGTSDSVQQRSP